jgi:hypothetical protein
MYGLCISFTTLTVRPFYKHPTQHHTIPNHTRAFLELRRPSHSSCNDPIFQLSGARRWRKRRMHEIQYESFTYSSRSYPATTHNAASFNTSQRKQEAGGTLLRCGGDCECLEQYSRYCCREHQLTHWKTHKRLCKGG